MKKIRQINNLKIYESSYGGYCVVTFSKIVLEDRLTLAQAIEFCENTKDYLSNKR